MKRDSNPFGGDENDHSLYRRRVLQLAASGTAAAGLGTTPASADEEFVEILGTDPSNYPIVDLSVSVDSDAGRDGELTKDEFEVYENGEPVEIADFEYSASALDLVFVFDDSGSMGNEIAAMKRGVKGLTEEIEAAGIDARYGLVSFRDDVDSDLTFTDDADSLADAVDSLDAYGGGDFPEDNFDAIATALEDEYRDDAQKVIVDITDATSHYDGDGSGYSEYTLTDVADDLNERGASFIAVSPGYDDPEASLKVLAEETDGLWIDIGDADFDRILRRITNRVIELYVLRYETSAAPGGVGAVAVEVDDPKLGTGESSADVSVPEDASDVPDGLLSEKEDLIEEIRTLAGTTMGESEADSRVDQRAESLIENVRDEEFDVDRDQYREALERIIAAEEVTKTGTETVTGDGNPMRSNLENLYSLLTGVALETLSAAAGGVVKRVTDSIVRGIARKFDDLVRSLSGRGVISQRTMRSVQSRLNRVTTRSHYTFKSFQENHPEQANDVVSKAGSKGLEAAEGAAGDVIGELNEERSLMDEIEELYFEGYYFQPDWPVVNIPAPEEIEVPDLSYSYDIPRGELPRWARGSVPDEISFDYETPDIDLPDGIDDVATVLEEIQELSDSGGIDTAIDDRAESMADDLGALNEQDDDTRDAVTNGLAAGISGFSQVTDALIDLLEELQGLLSGVTKFVDYLTIAAVVGGLALIATGVGTIGLLSIAGTLATISAALGIVGLAVDAVQISAGQNYLSSLTTIHHGGTYALTRTDLGGVDL